ncbi:uncharacterized protein MONOS_17680 [Monocercomonoides exilis]|uniref:uncharacterized protein n=1 Tax=Monocercomonoides exilis TaxID=2049356 RepID=UPI00355A4376|nr:hypothetical protein MONOS_17680 [Monocercomonoides exilis]
MADVPAVLSPFAQFELQRSTVFWLLGCISLTSSFGGVSLHGEAGVRAMLQLYHLCSEDEVNHKLHINYPPRSGNGSGNSNKNNSVISSSSALQMSCGNDMFDSYLTKQRLAVIASGMSDTAQGLSIIFLIFVESTSTLFQLIRIIRVMAFLLSEPAVLGCVLRRVLRCVLRRWHIITQPMNREYHKVLADYCFILHEFLIFAHLSADFSKIIVMRFFIVIIEK